MKLVSWNVNGIRAVMKKGLEDIVKDFDADIICFQETKMQEGQVEIVFEGYASYWDSAVKKGYSGTAVFTKIKPISVSKGMGIEEHDTEGRIVTLEFDEFYLVNVYTPNVKRELTRLEYRMKWEEDFLAYINELKKSKSVVVCGDLNVAHTNLDVKNWKSNEGNAGFTKEEREKLSVLLNDGYIDTFRHFYPDKEKFSWFSYFGKARENKVGWRIDYFIVSDDLKEKLVDAEIYDDVTGSDHCPVELILEI
ncbi:MAG: exodeoxyribonuclease III [Lachnospirales bacterium]